MPPRRRQQQLFEELGLLNAPAEPAPYATIGIAPEMAQRLLTEDPSGGSLQFAAKMLARAVSRHYHPDTSKVRAGRDERFRELTDAAGRIETADPSTLRRWLDKPVPQREDAGVGQRQAVFVERAANLVEQNMALGNHPLHFSQVRWSQGVLLRRQAGALLLREQLNGSTQVQQAQPPQFDTIQAADNFHRFLAGNGAFGLKAGTKLTTYIDDYGRASILTPDLEFVMDITNAVADNRAATSIYEAMLASWGNSPYPLVIRTQIPRRSSTATPETRMVSFPHTQRVRGRDVNLVWHAPLRVAGTLEDASYMERARAERRSGAAALRGAGARPPAKYFRLMATSAAALVAQEADYSPLVSPGNALLLYDDASRTPIATDAIVGGMLGNGAQTQQY